MADTSISAEGAPDVLDPVASSDRLPQSRKPYGPGDCLGGQYRLESLLGRGGMGEVWTARNETLNVLRAVKLIRADVGTSDNTDRLLREARAAAALADPAIVRVFDFGKTPAGEPYIVMELLEGEDLISIIDRRERLGSVKVVRLLLPVIRAMATAHAHGIVHRDLKPENIFLARLAGGRIQPKLLDFGIAKLENARALRLTTAGEVMGSPLYMAPEQARGEEVDERADIWALCVVLYEAITGDTPFTGDDRGEVFRAVNLSEPESLVALGLGDDALWQIVQRGLKKSREDRYQSMGELGRELAQWLIDQGVTDDIAGASLQAAWFRSSPQSFFSSSLPPGRRGLDVQLARARALLSRAAGSRAGRWLSSLPPLQRWGMVGALVIAMGTLIAVVAASGDDPVRQPAPLAKAAPTRAEARQPPPADSTLTPGKHDSRAVGAAPAPEQTTDADEGRDEGRDEAQDERQPEADDEADDEAEAKPPAATTSNARRTRTVKPRRARARRRSRLIDPY